MPAAGRNQPVVRVVVGRASLGSPRGLPRGVLGSEDHSHSAGGRAMRPWEEKRACITEFGKGRFPGVRAQASDGPWVRLR